MSALCDMRAFLGSEALGAGKVAYTVLSGIISWNTDPVGTAIRTANDAANSCNAGFAQYGGNGPSFEGFLQCVDNLNPIAAIRNNFNASLNATNLVDSGQSFGQGLLGVGLVAAPLKNAFKLPPANGLVPPLAALDCGPIAASSASRFGTLTYASSGIAPYRVQQRITAGQGGAIQAHHLIEQRFAAVMGQNVAEMPSIVVTQAEHQVFTNAWKDQIPRGSQNVTPTRVNDAARRVYADYPEILQALGLK